MSKATMARMAACISIRVADCCGRTDFAGFWSAAACRRALSFARKREESAPAFEELLYLGEEALMLRAALVVLLGLGFELLEQLALAAAEVTRRLHGDLDEHVAPRGAAQDRKPLAAEAELIAA